MEPTLEIFFILGWQNIHQLERINEENVFAILVYSLNLTFLQLILV